jgi:ketosteroid isomerase-like protein
MVVVIFISQQGYADDLSDLKATHAKYNKALNALDVETLYGFYWNEQIRVSQTDGFPSVLKTNERFKAGWTRVFASFERFQSRYITTDYRVIGNTGLVWGIRTELRKMKDRPAKRWFLATTIVYVKSDGEWKRVVTHSSPIPSEIQLP